MNNEITIFEPQNVGTIVSLAPQAYKDNRISHDKCIAFGKALLGRVNADGMNDTLDQEIATYIDRAKKTLRKMNANRSAVTQIFDSIRSAYTSIENEVDPAKKGTLPAKLQEIRNAYAAKKKEEREAENRRIYQQQLKSNAIARYATEAEDELLRQFNGLVAAACNRLVELDRTLTIENYEATTAAVKATDEELPKDWYENLRVSVPMPSALTPEEARQIAEDTKRKLLQRFTEQYAFEVSATRDEILGRLPSKRTELERIARANAEEAARIKAQMEERERKEAQQREKERLEREEKEKAEAALAAQKNEMADLFSNAQAGVPEYQPKMQVKKRISVLHPDGFMQILGMWWAQYGCTLSVDELEKEFRKQITFCNRLANDKDNPLLIRSEHIEYVEDVKAK